MIKSYDGRKTVIDHKTEETIEKTIEIGAWTSKYRTEHVMIHKSHDRGIFD